MNTMRKDQWIGVGLTVTLVVLVGVGQWQISDRPRQTRIAGARNCRGVMGTTCKLAAVVPPDRRPFARQTLREAEAVIRRVEAVMSTWLDDSEISKLNFAAAGQHVALSPESLDVLQTARKAFSETGGAFDVTCRPLVELWRTAAECDAVPGEAEMANARAASTWELICLDDSGAVKLADTARIDLGGIAKGYAIDRAVEILRRAELDGGLVDIGGDVVCFGTPPSKRSWEVDVQNPFGTGTVAQLQLTGGAVCTSGNYARYVEIAGSRYSHIIDPRTCRPADTVLSATVLAPTAMTADVWATALSVLGTDGFERLPESVDAMLVIGTKDNHQTVYTNGFQDRLVAESVTDVFPLDRQDPDEATWEADESRP